MMVVAMRTSITMWQRTNAFYIQSPRLQTALPVSVSENLEVRILRIAARYQKRFKSTDKLLSCNWRTTRRLNASSLD
jgi:hypothetical protein